MSVDHDYEGFLPSKQTVRINWPAVYAIRKACAAKLTLADKKAGRFCEYPHCHCKRDADAGESR